VDPRAGVDAVDKKPFFPFQESNPVCPACSPSLYRMSYPGRQLQNNNYNFTFDDFLHSLATYNLSDTLQTEALVPLDKIKKQPNINIYSRRSCE
jgi:hypothetical protein